LLDPSDARFITGHCVCETALHGQSQQIKWHGQFQMDTIENACVKWLGHVRGKKKKNPVAQAKMATSQRRMSKSWPEPQIPVGPVVPR
jgi:hypothetical protein